MKEYRIINLRQAYGADKRKRQIKVVACEYENGELVSGCEYKVNYKAESAERAKWEALGYSEE